MKVSVIMAPAIVNFDSYVKPMIKSVSSCNDHSGFVDDIGRLFMCGRNDRGQLGLGNFQDEVTPFYVSRIPDKVCEVACGEMHTIVLTTNGQCYTMGDNTQGQLGTGKTSQNGSPLPTFLEQISFVRVVKVRAGLYSAALSNNN